MAVIDAIVAALKAIPVVAEWFKKYELDIEQGIRKDIDEEHSKNSESGRPSNEFWEKRHL